MAPSPWYHEIAIMLTHNRVCHLTSVHSANDIRIFHKECATLAASGYEVTLVAPEGTGEKLRGVSTVPVPRRKWRPARMLLSTWDVFRAARKADSDIYHFHDPELIPAGMMLKLLGKRVIYDVHEDLPLQILDKAWIWPVFRRPISALAALIEWIGCRFFDGIVTATPSIASRFAPSKTIPIQNFPILDELVSPASEPYHRRKPSLGYVGVLSEPRGGLQLIEALGLVPESAAARLELAGTFSPESFARKLEHLGGWSRVECLGWQSREQVAGLLGRVRVGVVLFHPAANHVHSQPNKLFEYMSAALPVIASDFPLWRELIQDTGSGVLVNPMDPSAIAGAISWMMEHPAEAEKMGLRGRQAVRERYNWENEGKKLVNFYQSVIR